MDKEGLSGGFEYGVLGSPPAALTNVGKYRIDGVIGRGAVGIVYKGFDTAIERVVAVKTLREDVIEAVDDRAELLERFAREARCAGRCQHPNIVTVFDYVEYNSAPFIVMEHVAAGTLENVTRSAIRLPIKQIFEIMHQILSALQHAHDKKVVHRDIKPANILCLAASSVKITDFGVGRLSDLAQTSKHGASVLGTPNYMSPEQFLGRPADARSDLFAAGVILFQLLTGSKPYLADELPELMRKILNFPAPLVSSLRPDLKHIDAVVARSLERNVLDRFQSADDFISALNVAVANPYNDHLPSLDLTTIPQNPMDRKRDSSAHALNKTMADRLAPKTLLDVESAYRRVIGPMARVLLKRAAVEATDAEKLLAGLGAHINDPTEAKLFRQTAERLLREDDGVAAMQLDAIVSESEVRRATSELIVFLGPVAKILAQRHASTAVNLDDFIDHLAQAIIDPKDRKKFLDRMVPKSKG